MDSIQKNIDAPFSRIFYLFSGWQGVNRQQGHEREKEGIMVPECLILTSSIL